MIVVKIPVQSVSAMPSTLGNETRIRSSSGAGNMTFVGNMTSGRT